MTPALAQTQPTFWADGACADLPADWFHPDRGESTKEAKAVCSTCEVRVDCLTWALSTFQRFGIWGGTSERERRRIRRRITLGEPVPELDPVPATDDDHAVPDTIIIILEEEPTVELTVAPPPAPVPANGDTPAGVTAACAQCGKPFVKKRKDQRFHTKECAVRWYADHPATPRGRPAKKTRAVTAARAQVPPGAAPVPIRAGAVEGPTPPASTASTPPPGAYPVDLQVLLAQLLAGCGRWTVEAEVGDVHVTISRGG